MSRKPTPVDATELETLRQHVRIRSGLECDNFSHIRLLQEEIQKLTGENLSFQTLSRFFAMVRNEFNPSTDTLQIISRYLGYNNFKEFRQLNMEIDAGSHGQALTARIIVSLFSQLDPDEPLDGGMLQIVRNVANILKQRNRLTTDLHQAMAKNRYCRSYFFERLVNIDGLTGEYGEGLNYYLLHAWKREQSLFAHALYCYKAFLSGDIILFAKHFQFLEEYSADEIQKLDPLTAGRYYACLVFRHALEDEEAAMPRQGGDQVKAIVVQRTEKLVQGAGYIPGEAHILAGDLEQGWQLLNSHSMTSSSIPLQFNEELITEFNILRLFCGYFSGNISRKK
ncbi:MAG: hypothetical protein JST42_22865, partial [Bacteroidetes bacterium]|nr:hypothetical protein [Bacteroidota bacterium]